MSVSGGVDVVLQELGLDLVLQVSQQSAVSLLQEEERRQEERREEQTTIGEPPREKAVKRFSLKCIEFSQRTLK